ncbi:hypothetical protein ACTJJ7_11165 [Phyllobacterium sp. 22229]|uniref:hypothetical protein n=1 Tax=Phyllobacterium sp. 22229 TaxID=3453895 RepID=UPI003F872A48
MQNSSSELDHILAKRRQLRQNTAQALARIQKAHRQHRQIRTPHIRSGFHLQLWLQACLRSMEVRACAHLVALLNWCSLRLVWFALPRLATGRLTKRHARSLWRVIGKLNRIGMGIVRWQLRRHG